MVLDWRKARLSLTSGLLRRWWGPLDRTVQPWSGQAVNEYFIGLLIICTLYAVVAGGAPERIGALVYALSCVVTYVLLELSQVLWRSIEYGVFISDTLLLAFFCVFAVRANRYWPIWVSALLGLGLFGHLARWVGPDVVPWAYAVVLTIWSYPILAIIALGTFNHQQRLKRFGVDRSWSSSSGRSAPPDGPAS